MRKKSGPIESRQAELPLTDKTQDEGQAEKVEKTTGNRYERKVPAAVFEFEEGGPGHPPRAASVPEAAGVSRGVAPAAGEATEEAPGTVGTSAAERLFEEAKRASKGGRLEEAARLYRGVLAIEPAHVRARNNLGVLLDQMGDHEVALEHFQAALELQPENGEILANLGAALASQGRYDEAETQLRRAARLDPAGIDVRTNLGILYYRRGLYAQADHELRWVCEQDPNHSVAHFYRGEALNRLGRVEEALETLERASHLQPDRGRIYYLMGILYDKKNLKEEAGVMYRKARELSDR